MPKIKLTTKQVLERTKEMISWAEFGYKTLHSNSVKDKKAGLVNVIVFGRAVTNVLQKLKTTEPNFELWYKAYVDEMETDPLMKYFYNLRSAILKAGQPLNLSSSTFINHFSSADFARIPLPPPNVKIKGFFMGDNLGGNGYEIELSDGSIEHYYIDIPSDIGRTILSFENPPSSHLGKPLTDYSIDNLSRLYLDYLQRMLKDANARFDKK
ncbi:MAG: hypothetical protein ABSF44_15705 [Candidatus Bathyarchaeia archaeon]|jgi:hypothetical protein